MIAFVLDGRQIFGLVALGLMAGYFAGCVRAAWVELRSEGAGDANSD